ncbi:hypothetical protein PQO03_00395 [Lentisphaera profundi]|uniref:Uncharacterized protein n=1 Tax=Lentisphaera profundi TaxID=1658616 RepID=A0ABY7VQF3_9BACT|nr:hypothetical protein [Lentisphaera profundi]WDE96425.1 hypothetical protein PQO03_00395 [Lentisphaera profundi]
MNKEDFRLNNDQQLALRSALKKQPSMKRSRFILPAYAAVVLGTFLLVNPKTDVNPPNHSQEVIKEQYSHQDLVKFEREFETRRSANKRVRKDKVKVRFQARKKSKSANLAEKMAGTRLRLNKLKSKINS